MSGVGSLGERAPTAAGRVRIELSGADLTYRLVRRGEDPALAPVPESDALVPYLAYDATAEIDGIGLSDPVTLLVLPNEHTPSPRVSTGSFASNAHVEATWREARARLSGEGVEGFARLDPAFDALAPIDEPLRHPPITYCRKVGAYFSPVCPSCLGPLATCRDDALLHRLYLPPHASSLSRYLYCRECASTQRPVTLYTYELRDPRGAEGIRVRRRGELYRDLVDQIKSTPTRQPEGHPCFACEHRETCYPAGADGSSPIPAEDQLVSVAYYDFEFLPVRRLPLAFDAAARLLGGGEARPEEMGALEGARSDSSRSFLFREHREGLFEAEVLALKLHAFTSVVRAAATLHGRARRPHLGLSHANVRARVRSGGEAQPSVWGMALEIQDLVSAAPAASATGSAETPDVWAPPYATTPSYLPSAASSPPVERLWMTLRKATVSPVDRESVSIEAQLSIDDHTMPALGRHDVLVLELPGSSPILAVGHAAGGDERRIRFEGAIQGADEALVARIRSEGISPGRTGVTVNRVWHAPVDVYALGVLLARLLFLNDSDTGGAPGPEALEAAAEAIVKARSERASVDVPALCAAAGVPSRPGDVLHRRSDRDASEGRGVPADVWTDVLLLVTGMASNVPGFSICESMDDFPAEAPGEPLEHVLRTLGSLVERLQGALFGTGGRNDLVLAALDDYLDDYQEAVAGEEGETSTTGFKTIIGQRPK